MDLLNDTPNKIPSGVNCNKCGRFIGQGGKVCYETCEGYYSQGLYIVGGKCRACLTVEGGRVMKSVTVNQVLSWKPCEEYTRERLEELFAGRETVNVHDVLEMDISDADKLWAVLREEFLPAETLHEYACRVAERALLAEREVGREPDKRSWQAIEAKRKWIKGEITDDELLSARAAAWEAAREAAGVAAWEAAREAAGVAAWEAVWVGAAVAGVAARETVWVGAAVAGVAARETVGLSAWAAWEAAQAEQIEILKELLKGEE